MAMALAEHTDAVAQGEAIGAAGALHRAMMHRKDHRVAAAERHHRSARLHPWPLLGDHELAADKILTGLRQQECDLQRKYMLAIEVLVQAVVVARHIFEQQRGRPRLPGCMAAL